MVLLGANNLSRFYGRCKGAPVTFNIGKLSSRSLSNILLNLCKACQTTTMAAIPPCTFTAGRIRESQRAEDLKLAKTVPKAKEFKFFETMFGELTPLKYNSKLMNSIWGFYNRYSPHNVKKVNEAFVFNGDLQQSAASPPNKGEPMISLPPAGLDNVWAAINVSQSH